MTLCNEGCVPMCDFCKHMTPYSEEECERTENFGICNKHNEVVEFLHNYCEDFECIRNKTS